MSLARSDQTKNGAEGAVLDSFLDFWGSLRVMPRQIPQESLFLVVVWIYVFLTKKKLPRASPRLRFLEPRGFFSQPRGPRHLSRAVRL